MNTTFYLIKYSFILLKIIFNSHNLNNSYKGGINSFCLYLLLLALFIFRKNQYKSYFEVIIDFINFYGNIYIFENNVIDFKYQNPYVNKLNTSQINNYLYFTNVSIETNSPIVPIIIDPLFNNKNIAQNCFDIENIKKTLSSLYSYIDNCYNDIFIYYLNNKNINICNNLNLTNYDKEFLNIKTKELIEFLIFNKKLNS